MNGSVCLSWHVERSFHICNLKVKRGLALVLCTTTSSRASPNPVDIETPAFTANNFDTDKMAEMQDDKVIILKNLGASSEPSVAAEEKVSLLGHDGNQTPC